MTAIKRALSGAPVAMVITAGLGVLMAGLIKVEHSEITEKPEQLSFVINQEPTECLIRPALARPEIIDVEVPPPPPKIATDPSNLPKINLVELDPKPPALPKPTIKWTKASFTISDREAVPVKRFPPSMPKRFMEGNNSGHCKVRFDVSPQGSPFNVVITYCSDPILQKPTIKSVLKWKFAPKRMGGEVVAMHGVENKVSYNLLDQNGNLLPEL